MYCAAIQRCVVTSIVLALCTAGSVLAQAFPSKPIRIIVPFGPGSGSDQMARMIADRLTEQMNATVLVENREGAGGVIGTQFAARSAPDGHTLVLVSNTMLIAPLLHATAPYDALRDFVTVARVSINPLVLLTSPGSPYKTVPEMVTHLKAHADRASYATSGKGSHGHLEAALLMRHFGITMPDVPYKTTTQAITDTSTGQVSFYVAGLGPALAQIKGGKLRALAVGGGKRLAALPDVPTFAEATKQPGYEFVAWVGLLAPAGTSPEIVARLSEEIARASESPQVMERLSALNNQVLSIGPTAFGEQMRAETEKWTVVVKALKLVPE